MDNELEKIEEYLNQLTEKEKLEAEVAKQKKESEKNISIITELEFKEMTK